MSHRRPAFGAQWLLVYILFVDVSAYLGFKLPANCEELDIGNPSNALRMCPTHCKARLAYAKEQTSEHARLAVLSPRWNASAGDPLLSHSLLEPGVQSVQRRHCVQLVQKLARIVAAQARSSSSWPLFQRAIAYYHWVRDHEPLSGDVNLELSSLQSEYRALQLLPSVDLRSLDLWTRTKLTSRLENASNFANVSVKKTATDPPMLVFDGVLSEQDCNALAAWQDRIIFRAPQPWHCFVSTQEALYATKLEMTHGLVSNKMACFNATTSAQTLSDWNYVRSLCVTDGAGTEGTLFQDSAEEPFRKIEEFLAGVLGLPLPQADCFNAAIYQSGDGYGLHLDCSHWKRQVTALAYVSDSNGGETVFPEAFPKPVRLKPKCGRVAIWHNMKPNGECNGRARHEATAVKEGAKRILQRWYFSEPEYREGRIRALVQLPPGHKPFQSVIMCMGPGNCREEMFM